jgi:phosphate uptake regulator
MVHDMFGDAVRAVADHDAELAHDIVARDEDVDRLYLMLYRQFRIVLCDLLAEEALGVSRIKLFDTHTVARQLERVADHAVKIARVTTSLSRQPPQKVADALRRSGDQVTALLRESVDAFRGENPDLASRVIDSALGLEDRLMRAVKLLWDLDPHGAQLIGIAFDSIRRVRDYSINIAETALNTAVPLS